MNAQVDKNARKGLRGWWMSPPRSGLRLIIAPPEYRHLRGFMQVHMFSCIVLTCLALVTLGAGGNDAKTYLFALVFAAGGAAHLTVALWEQSILRSQASAI